MQVLKFSAAFLGVTAALAQMGYVPPGDKEAPVKPVSFERILAADKTPGDWLTYSGNMNGQRHSPLTQITPDNVKDLQLKWVFQSRTVEKMEVTPLVVDGVMYTVQGITDVIAMDAATGKPIWTFRYKNDPSARNCCGQLTRGLAILGDKVFLAALDNTIYAINAKSGKEVWHKQVADPKLKYSLTHAPLAVKDKILVGTAGGEYGIRGFIAAYDANTGNEVWKFYTVPGPGEKGNETWSGNSWEHGSGAIWVTGTYDPESNLTFWGTGNPGPDWDGDARLGDNLYTSSVVALNADTGKIQWHYQFSPHNEFDWDATQVPVLANVTFQGRPRKGLLFANRNGLVYLIDRTNGQFLYGKDMTKTNWYTGFDERGRPIAAPGVKPSKEGTRVMPGNQGATNWYNPSFSPRTGLFYVPTWQNSSSTYLKGEEPPEFHVDTTYAGLFPKFDRNPDEYSAISAFEAGTGAKKWEFKFDAQMTEGGLMNTASDLLFGGGRDGQFVALDARTGKKLWETNLGPSVAAGPMTYMVNGKQYLSIQAGTALYTFALPSK